MYEGLLGIWRTGGAFFWWCLVLAGLLAGWLAYREIWPAKDPGRLIKLNAQSDRFEMIEQKVNRLPPDRVRQHVLQILDDKSKFSWRPRHGSITHDLPDETRRFFEKYSFVKCNYIALTITTPAPVDRESDMLYIGSFDPVELIIEVRGFDLRLMSVNDLSEVPDTGAGLLILAKHGESDTLVFRAFNADGELVLDRSETEIPNKSDEIATLKEVLADLWDQECPKAGQAASIKKAVTSITGHTLIGNDDVLEIFAPPGEELAHIGDYRSIYHLILITDWFYHPNSHVT